MDWYHTCHQPLISEITVWCMDCWRERHCNYFFHFLAANVLSSWTEVSSHEVTTFNRDYILWQKKTLGLTSKENECSLYWKYGTEAKLPLTGKSPGASDLVLVQNTVFWLTKPKKVPGITFNLGYIVKLANRAWLHSPGISD